MKYEQKVHVETSEYICFVKRIDGVIAQKTLIRELIRCENCKWSMQTNFTDRCGILWCDNFKRMTSLGKFCDDGRRKDDETD